MLSHKATEGTTLLPKATIQSRGSTTGTKKNDQILLGIPWLEGI